MPDSLLSQLPSDFLSRLTELLSPEELSAWKVSASCPPLAVRWTGDADACNEACESLVEAGLAPTPVPWCPQAWSLGCIPRSQVSRLPLVAEQKLFLQSLSSMAAVMAMGVRPGDDVLDLCAAPGAKTSLIRRQQNGRGMLLANELSRSRTIRLKTVLAKLSIEGVEVLTGPGESIGSTHERCFDRVLADVPCSGEGRFHLSDASTWSRWSESGIRGLAKRQGALLESACKALRPGGEVLYSTCTMAHEENEGVVDRVLRRGRTLMEVRPIDLPLSSMRPGLQEWRGRTLHPEIARTVRVLGDSETIPFFMARLRRIE